MIIANLNYLDTVSQNSEIVGGDAVAVATAGAFARGRYFAATGTATNTLALALGRRGNIAKSGSISVSTAS